jgi:hypothetical protein
MAQERIELRLSPANPDEQALNVALDRLGEEYGAKGRFLKVRLLRGYVAFMREVESIRRESDPLAALDRIAQSVNSGHYRVLRAMLYVRTPTHASGGKSAPESAHASQPAPAQPLVEHARAPSAAPIEPTSSSSQPDTSAPPAVAVPNWSVFAEIAGKKVR